MDIEIERKPILLKSLPVDGVPLHNHPDGQVRIVGTRISLEIFMGAYKLGARTPEQLARRFDTVSAADAKAVLTYYTNNENEVDEYLRLSEEKAERIRTAITSQPEYIERTKRTLRRARAKGLME